MPNSSDSEHRIARRRRVLRVAVFMLALTVLTALNFAYRFEARAPHLLDFLRLGALILLALVIAVRATTSFSLFGGNPAMNDELVQANRAAAAKRAFWMMMVTAAAVCVASVFFPFTAYEVMLVMLFAGAGAAGLSFARLEAKGSA